MQGKLQALARRQRDMQVVLKAMPPSPDCVMLTDDAHSSGGTRKQEAAAAVLE